MKLLSLLLFPALIGYALGSAMPYSFNYEANDEGQHQRSEQGQHGTVQGSYSYVDPNGHLRQVNYIADEDGFRPSGDIGVDRETEQAAAELAAQAPQDNANYQAPGSSYGSGSSSYGGGSKGGYSQPAPKPRPPRPSYQSPAKGGYQRPQPKQTWQPQQKQQQWTPSKPPATKSYGGSNQDSYSYKTQITHNTPPRQQTYKAPRAQKPSYRPQQQQQQQQQDWGSHQQQQQQQEDDGSYDQSNDWEEQSSRGPKQTVSYEVRAPTHKIFAKYN